MELYVGLDVSLKETSICVVDGNGKIVSEGSVVSEPDAIARHLRTKAVNANRIGLETGPTATWLWHELRVLRLPVICIDARHAKAALSMQINKSDRNDAAGIARIMQCSRCAADAPSTVVQAQSLGTQAMETHRLQDGQDRRSPETGRHPPSHVV